MSSLSYDAMGKKIIAGRFHHRTASTEATGPELVVTFICIEIELTDPDLSTTARIGTVKTAIADVIDPRFPDPAFGILFSQIGVHHIQDLL
jgi:hypothetical protein